MLELGFAGIHARPLELAGWEVVVVEPDPVLAERAREREARVVERAEGRFDAVVAPAGANLAGRPSQDIRGYLDDLAAGRPPLPAAGAHRAGRRMHPVRPAAHTGRPTWGQPGTGAGSGAN